MAENPEKKPSPKKVITEKRLAQNRKNIKFVKQTVDKGAIWPKKK